MSESYDYKEVVTHSNYSFRKRCSAQCNLEEGVICWEILEKTHKMTSGMQELDPNF